MYDLNVRYHVVLARKFFETYRTRIVFDVLFVRCYVVTTEIAYVGVRTMTYGTTINVAFFDAKIANRTLGSIGLDFEATLEIALTYLGLARDKIVYGTAEVFLRHLCLGLAVGILLFVQRRYRRRVTRG